MPHLLKPCGTRAAYARHLRNGEVPCEACKKANRVREAAIRGEPRPLQPCGTVAAYRRHRYHREEPCEACRSAYNASRNTSNRDIRLRAAPLRIAAGEAPEVARRLIAAVVEQRKNVGLSQTDVAKAMHDIGFRWYQPTVAKVENGERPLRFDEGIALADIFAIDLMTFRSTFDAVCRTCFNRPPSGFTCNACGRPS